MKLLRLIVATSMGLLLTSCMMSSGPVTTKQIRPGAKGDKVVTILNQTPYLSEMTVALAEYGFRVKPMPSQQFVTEKQGVNRVGQYNEASTRYGITLTAAPTSTTCALTDSGIYNFTLMVTDIQTNEIVSVFKQKGSDGPCTTIKPVFDTLAAAMAASW